MPTTADVRLDHITKRFHEVVAVDDLSLEIERGEFFSMLGPSGCGKTTTLRMIGGFEEATAGDTTTFPLWVYGASRIGIPPEVNALGTIFFLTAFAFTAMQVWAQRRGGRTEEAGSIAVASR